MVVQITIHEVGYALIREQLNDQMCLQISLSEEELEKIPRHKKNGKKFIDISIRIRTLQMCMDGEIESTMIGYCPNYVVNERVPISFGLPTYDSAVNWVWNDALPVARSEIQLHDEIPRQYSLDGQFMYKK